MMNPESDAQSSPEAKPMPSMKKEGPGHPLGPYAPRSAGRPSGEPGPDGQYKHPMTAGKVNADPKGMPAKPNPVPGPNGQYDHTKYMGGK